jgi:hypothetical protein
VKYVVSLIALCIGGWMLFEGCRALTVGDYITPGSGASAGQLGPWSRVVRAAGLEPRSTPVKLLHVGLGAFWLAALAGFYWRHSLGWWALFGAAFATVWYLPIGTALSIVELFLLYFLRFGAAKPGLDAR